VNRNIHIGRQGELLAASILEGYDIRTCHVDIARDDLWAKAPSNKFFSVQVKTASHPILNTARHTVAKYNFCMHNNQNYTGVFLFLALDLQILLGRKGTTVSTKSFKLNPSEFTKQAQDQTIREAFEL
jgi:hypothetical protein